MSLFPDLDAAAVEAARAAAEHEQRLRDHGADFTPRFIARPLVDRTMRRVMDRIGTRVRLGDRDNRPPKILGVCSGPGVFESEVLRWAHEHGIDVHITAVEIRDEEHEHLVRHAHRVIIGDWHVGLGMEFADGRWQWTAEPPEFDLLISNPDFKRARAPRREDGSLDPASSMPLLGLAVADVVALYGTQQCWTKTASGYSVRMLRSYDFVTDVPGSVGHRGRGGGQDQVPYSMFTWVRGARSENAITSAIPPPTTAERNWIVRPGTEPDEWLLANGIPVFKGIDGERVLVRPGA